MSNLVTVENYPGTEQELRVVWTYSLRLARRCFLQHFCTEDNPVLHAELALVEMAKSKLQEHILITVPVQDMQAYKPILKAKIRRIARSKIIRIATSEDVQEAAIAKLEAENLDDIFPSIH
jgi:hypothetical protein